MPLLPSSTTFFFFLPHILGIRFFFFLVLIPFSQLHPSFHTLYTLLLSSLFSLLLFLSSSMLLGIDCTTHFLLVSQKEIFVLNFCESVPSCLCILQFIYVATIFFVIYSLSSRSMSLEGILSSPQYSCTFSYMGHASLLSCYVFYGLAIYTISFSFQPQYLGIPI